MKGCCNTRVRVLLQGAPLFDNLCRSLTGQPLQPYKPQQQALALISTGDRYATGLLGYSFKNVSSSGPEARIVCPKSHSTVLWHAVQRTRLDVVDATCAAWFAHGMPGFVCADMPCWYCRHRVQTLPTLCLHYIAMRRSRHAAVPYCGMLCCAMAHRYAVGSRGWLSFQGKWAWWLKDYIDQAFMHKYGRDLK